MSQLSANYTETFKHWQSSASMIPVVLELLRENLNYLDERNRIPSEFSSAKIQAYKTLYQHWQKEKNLNLKQREWIQEMGSYLTVLQQILIRS